MARIPKTETAASVMQLPMLPSDLEVTSTSTSMPPIVDAVLTETPATPEPTLIDRLKANAAKDSQLAVTRTLC